LELLYRPDLPAAPMQINRRWLLWDLILRITDSLTLSIRIVKDWNVLPQSVVSTGSLALF